MQFDATFKVHDAWSWLKLYMSLEIEIKRKRECKFAVGKFEHDIKFIKSRWDFLLYIFFFKSRLELECSTHALVHMNRLQSRLLALLQLDIDCSYVNFDKVIKLSFTLVHSLQNISMLESEREHWHPYYPKHHQMNTNDHGCPRDVHMT